MKEETKNILVAIPIELLEQIEVYQKDNYISTRTPAIISLIRKGLESEAKK